MKKVIVLVALILGLGVVPQVWGGMSDIERVCSNSGDSSIKLWNNIARNWISPANNGPCKNIYRPFVKTLGKDIGNATNAELATAMGFINGVSIDIATGEEIKAVMLAVEDYCKGVEAAAKKLPANN